MTRAVVLDTDVFSALYVMSPELAAKQGHPVDAWLAGAYLAGWGDRRLDALLTELDLTPTIDEDRAVVEAYARLVSEARKVGHPLGAPGLHIGDRWVAACAIAKDLPLLTGYRKHFENAPGLRLLD